MKEQGATNRDVVQFAKYSMQVSNLSCPRTEQPIHTYKGYAIHKNAEGKKEITTWFDFFCMFISETCPRLSMLTCPTKINPLY